MSQPGEHEVDPYDGQPLRFRGNAELITVYSVGRNKADAGGQLAPPHGAPDVGVTLRRK